MGEQEIKDEMNVEKEINKQKENNELVDNAIISTPNIIRSIDYQKNKPIFEEKTRTNDPTTEIPINQKSGTSSKIKKKKTIEQSIKNSYLKNIDINNKRHSIRKLRPKKPILSSCQESVLSVCQMLSNKRSDAVLIVDSRGSLVGILTDIDITLRVVAKNLNPSLTLVSKVMTINPKMVSMDDFAMDALAIMMDNHFRHLPVVNKKFEVVGLLDIAKCLNDAIEKLELIEEKKNKNKTEDAVKQLSSFQGLGDSQSEYLSQILGNIISQSFGNTASPTLRSLLSSMPTTIVSFRTSVKEAGDLMAQAKKAALIEDSGKLVGIFGFKDMMTRVVSKELPLHSTPISNVMTLNPYYVSPDMTVVEALQVMHDNKFLSLPVCDNDKILGVVDVMDLIYGCGSTEGWRSLFKNAIDSVVDEVDNKSVFSVRCQTAVQDKNICSTMSSNAKNDVRKIEKLRPKKPILSSCEGNVLSVCQMLSNKRSDAALIVDSRGSLVGILTDIDITLRVVAKNLNPSLTLVSKVMTINPKMVSMDDFAMDALAIMMDNHFRHLPVVNKKCEVV